MFSNRGFTVLLGIDEYSMPLDRARRVVSDASIFRIDKVKKVNMSSFYSNIMPEFYLKKHGILKFSGPYFDLWRI